MIVLARLEAQHGTMQELLADLDKAQDAIGPVLTDGTEISDEHYERMSGGEAHPPYFKGRRVFKLPDSPDAPYWRFTPSPLGNSATSV